MNEVAECGACCRGSAPWFICRDKECLCHVEKHLKAIKTPMSLGYNDPTARKALRKLGAKNDHPRR